MRISYAHAEFGEEEKKAVRAVLDDPSRWLAPGKKVKEFEQKTAVIFGKKHGAMVNSGSSANYLALLTLGAPGMEVLTPVVTFATTVAPILQLGMKPVFFDVSVGGYQIDIDALEAYLKKAPKKKRILMVPALIGNLPDLPRLRRLSKRYGMPFVLDSCDTMGATWKGTRIGHYADVVTSSYYGSHIITTAGAGGILMTDDAKLAERFLVLRGWGRTSALFGESEDIEKRFNTKVDGIPYDAKFIFIELGYNMQVTEIQGAFGVEQLKRLPRFMQTRIRNYRAIRKHFAKSRWFVLPDQPKEAATSWMNFPLTLTKDCPFTRKQLALHLEKADIQTRPLFTGNILRQPAFKKAMRGADPARYPNAEHIMRNTLVFGCHQALTDKHLKHLFATFDSFLAPYE